MNKFLSVKDQERISRHLRRSSGLKRGSFNFTCKKGHREAKHIKLKLFQPKYKRYCQKRALQRRVIHKKEARAGSLKGTSRGRGSKRSKSLPVEPKLYSLEKVKLRISAKVQKSLDRLRGLKPTRLVRFAEVQRQFGEVIDRIKQLKFSLED